MTLILSFYKDETLHRRTLALGRAVLRMELNFPCKYTHRAEFYRLLWHSLQYEVHHKETCIKHWWDMIGRLI